jgi:hypothetical protein
MDQDVGRADLVVLDRPDEQADLFPFVFDGGWGRSRGTECNSLGVDEGSRSLWRLNRPPFLGVGSRTTMVFLLRHFQDLGTNRLVGGTDWVRTSGLALMKRPLCR